MILSVILHYIILNMAEPVDEPHIDVDDESISDDTPEQEYENEIQNNNLTSCINGMTYEEIKSLKLPYNEHMKYGQCIYCLKFYNNGKNGMITKEFDDSGDSVCYHCIFWINYGLEQRQQVDGVFGKTIVSYINECKDSHNKDICTKNTDGGGCFLCDALNGIPIENIIDGDTLNCVNIIEQQKVEDEDSFKITI